MHVTAEPTPPGRLWYHDLTPDQRKAFWAAYLGWTLDGFDYYILSLLLVDVQRSFTVSSALAGALATVTLMFRVFGGISAGIAADRWGRKLPLMLAILWYSTFAFLSAFSTSYGMLFAFRALFGVGMGGVWSAGMPLAIEHCPPRHRGLVSGLLQGGYALGVILAAAVYQFGYPLVSDRPEGWRMLMWVGILPALLVPWIMKHVKESPVWLERRQHVGTSAPPQGSFANLFRRDLLPITLHTSFLLASLLFLYNSITWWYPTLLDSVESSAPPVHHRVLGRRHRRFLHLRTLVGDPPRPARVGRAHHPGRPGVGSALSVQHGHRRPADRGRHDGRVRNRSLRHGPDVLEPSASPPPRAGSARGSPTRRARRSRRWDRP